MIGATEFIVVFFVLYILECFRTVRPDELIFDRTILSGHHIRKPIFYPGNGTWGWLVLNPFRPDGPIFSVPSPTYAVTPSGVLTSCDGEKQFTLYSFECCDSVRIDGLKVVLQDGCISTRSSADATRLARVFREFAAAKPKERTKRLEKVYSEPFAVSQIETVLSEFRRHTSSLRLFSTALFAVCFLIFPLLLSIVGLNAALLRILPVVAIFSMASAYYYRRAVEALLPSTPRLDIYGNVVKLALYPISSLRSVEMVSYNLLSKYDPIAIAVTVCGPKDAARLAVREMIRLEYGSDPGVADDQILAAIAEYRKARLRYIESFCSDRDITIGDWKSAPIAQNNGCLTYCPSCGIQYRLAEGVCADCADISLQPLKAKDGIDA